MDERLRGAIVEQALLVAEVISLVEQGQVAELEPPLPDGFQGSVDNAVARLSDNIDNLERAANDG